MCQLASLLKADVLSEYLNYEDTKFSKSRNVGYVHGSNTTTGRG
jgi:methionyl-tRNA synthetase